MEVPFLVAATERRSVRRHVRLECEVVRERGFRLLGRHAVDLSTSGMRIAAMDHALTGEPVVLAFRAPGSETWVDAEGLVARVVHGRRDFDFGPSIAIAFRELPDQLRGILRKQLLKCPPTQPKRALRVDYAASVRRIGDL
jgi:hypothetical protein